MPKASQKHRDADWLCKVPVMQLWRLWKLLPH